MVILDTVFCGVINLYCVKLKGVSNHLSTNFDLQLQHNATNVKTSKITKTVTVIITSMKGFIAGLLYQTTFVVARRILENQRISLYYAKVQAAAQNLGYIAAK